MANAEQLEALNFRVDKLYYYILLLTISYIGGIKPSKQIIDYHISVNIVQNKNI